MSHPPTAEPPAGRTQPPLPRDPIAPLAPVLVPLALAAIAIAAAFSWLFPFKPKAQRAAPARFADVTRESGIAFSHRNGGPDTPTTLAGAVAFIDYDNDGLPDLFFASGIAWPWEAPSGGAPTFKLYHNEGHGRFADVTRAAGLDVGMPAMGVAVGDYDGDGFQDIFVAGVGGNRLFRNLGNGRFSDVTEEAGVGGDDHVWSTGAVWIDIYGDGRLDLVVCNYARWSRESDLRGAFAAEGAGPSYTNPGGFVSAFPSVYRNRGDGRFEDVSDKTGLNLIDRQTGYPRAKPLAVAAVDVNGDGRMDLLFSYQTGEDVLFLNQGDGTFRQWTPQSGALRGGGSASLVGAGALSLSGSTGGAERFRILRAAGLALGGGGEESGPYCRLRDKLGVALADYDLDGRMDILSGEGLAEPGLARFESGREFASAPRVLWNDGRAWADAPLVGASGALGGPLVARGLAVADVEGNGSLYLAVAQNGAPAVLYRGEQHRHRAWLRIDLVGTRCTRDGWGAQVEVHTPKGILVQTLEPAMGFMAQSEKTLTFGLGDDDRVRRIVVRWPDGTRQEVRSVEANRRIVITEK